MWDCIDNRGIYYDSDSIDLSKLDNYESMTFKQLEKLRFASQPDNDKLLDSDNKII